MEEEYPELNFMLNKILGQRKGNLNYKMAKRDDDKVPRWAQILMWIAALLFILSFIWRKAAPPNPFKFPVF